MQKTAHTIEGLMAVFDVMPVQAIVVDSAAKITAVNRAKRESGDRLPEIGMMMYKDYAAGHLSDMHGALVECMRTGEAKDFPEQQYGDKILSIKISPFDGGAVIVSEDMTKCKCMESSLKRSEALQRAITEAAHDAIIMIDEDGLVSFWNPAAERILGFTTQEIMGKSLHQLVLTDESCRENFSMAYRHFQRTGTGIAVGTTVDLRAKHANGTIIDVQLSLSAINSNGSWHAVGILRDVTEHKAAVEALRESEERFRKLSTQDDLTGLHNSRFFWEAIRREVDFAKRYERPLALCMMDVDNFKMFNDQYGHERGNEVLELIGRIMKGSLVRNTDIACRYGGEEFVLILPMTRLIESARAVERIRRRIAHEKLPFDEQAHVTVSCGIVQYDGEDVKDLVIRADTLMRQAKKEGKNQVCT